MTWAQTAWNIWVDLKSVNWIEWAKVTFDLVKGIAWPAALFFVVFMFRHEIRKRIPYLRSASATGVEFDPQEQAQLPTQPVGRLEEDHPLKFAQLIEEKLLMQLNETPEEKRIPMLVRTLAVTQIEREFENIFANIFESQITFLRRISTAPISREKADEYYESVVRPVNKTLYEDVSFSDWAEFLENRGLIVLTSEKVEITDLGTDFIIFVDVRKPGVVRYN